MKLAVFYHMTDFPVGHSIIESQINTIIESGIIEHSELFFYCNYNIANYDWLKERLKNYTNISYIDNHIEPRDWEIPTLKSLKDYCDNVSEETYVLYIHHKGVTHIGNEAVNDWRNLMMYFNVTKWRECVEQLDNGHDTAGVLWRGNYHHLHYSGNFWWAKSSYIKKLPTVRMPVENNYFGQFGLGPPGYLHKMDAEFWIGLGNPKAYSFQEFTVDHYTTRYPPELYVK
jgi:hypothetical protein